MVHADYIKPNCLLKSMLDDCLLKDLGYEGIPYTWCNKRRTQESISERLDRALANWSWCNLWPMVKVYHGHAAHSDHVPVILQLNGGDQNRRGKNFSALKPCG